MANPPLGKTTLPESAIGAPALANVNQYTAPLAIAWTGTDQTHHLNVTYSNDGTTFSGKITLNETSIDGPGLAFGNKTYISLLHSNRERQEIILMTKWYSRI